MSSALYFLYISLNKNLLYFKTPTEIFNSEDINIQRNIFIEKSNKVLEMFDYAIDENEKWKKKYFNEEK